MKKLLKIYEDAPPIGKILIILAVLVICYLIFKGLKKAFKSQTTSENTVDTASDELKQLAEAGEKPNYSASQYNTWAEALYTAMESVNGGFGTDEDAIKQVFSYMQNKADVLQLIKTFGIRPYEDDKLLMFNINDYNLNEWLSAELSASEKAEYVNNVLKSRNINYSF